MQNDLFTKNTEPPSSQEFIPLAEQLRPQTLADIIGQEHLLADNGPLKRMIAAGKIRPLILWGPPGCGKTSLARLLAQAVGLPFVALSAVLAGVADLRKVFETAYTHQKRVHQPTILFIDEIHRFNRAQQDALLAPVEEGTILLIGATTENPSFALNGALISRVQVVTVHSLSEEALATLLERAEAKTGPLLLELTARQRLIQLSDGDGRALLNMVESLLLEPPSHPLSEAELGAFITKRAPLYDKHQDQHYNLISVLHKALRSSDTDAALYWFARMLAGGEDPLYIARRLIRFASEDIGMADPQALPIAIAATQAYERLGTPEGELALAECVVYLGTAPKSNAVYTAFKKAAHIAKEKGSLNPPPHSLNAPTPLMKKIGYSQGYIYDHDTPNGCSGLNYFPTDLPRQTFYDPPERGFEREIRKRLTYWQKIRTQK